MKSKTLSTLLLIAGVALLVLGYFEPQISASFVTVVTDDTPPFWLSDGLGHPLVSPYDGGTYPVSLSTVDASVADPESGVVAVGAIVDGTLAGRVTLSLTSGDAYSGHWTGAIPAALLPLSVGQHTIYFTAANGVDATCRYPATDVARFTIVSNQALTGNWYIENTLITSSSQTLYFQKLALAFKFTPTVIVDPAKIACIVKEGASELFVLTYNTVQNAWIGTYTFSGGSHTLSLQVSDGANPPITFATLSINFGSAPFPVSASQMIMVAGVGLAGVGGWMKVKKKR